MTQITYSAAQAAEILDVDRTTIFRRIRRGELTPVAGSRRPIRISAVDLWRSVAGELRAGGDAVTQ